MKNYINTFLLGFEAVRKFNQCTTFSLMAVWNKIEPNKILCKITEAKHCSFATLDKKNNDVYDLTKHFPILLDHIFLTNLMRVSNMVSKLLNTSTNLFAH